MPIKRVRRSPQNARQQLINIINVERAIRRRRRRRTARRKPAPARVDAAAPLSSFMYFDQLNKLHQLRQQVAAADLRVPPAIPPRPSLAGVVRPKSPIKKPPAKKPPVAKTDTLGPQRMSGFEMLKVDNPAPMRNLTQDQKEAGKILDYIYESREKGALHSNLEVIDTMLHAFGKTIPPEYIKAADEGEFGWIRKALLSLPQAVHELKHFNGPHRTAGPGGKHKGYAYVLNDIKASNASAALLAQEEEDMPPAEVSYPGEVQLSNLPSELDSEVSRRHEEEESASYEGFGKKGGPGLTDESISQLIADKCPSLDRYFGGVILRDEISSVRELSKKHPTAFIVHIPFRRNGSDGHWVALYVDPTGHEIDYYDSFGRDPSAATMTEIRKMMAANGLADMKFKTNAIRQQSYSSDECGWFAIDFLNKRVRLRKLKGAFGLASGFADFVRQALARGVSPVSDGEARIQAVKRDFKTIA